MFAGFYSIISSINGEFTIAAISIMIAMMWDTLDGRVARLTNTQSAFGAEYDNPLSGVLAFEQREGNKSDNNHHKNCL